MAMEVGGRDSSGVTPGTPKPEAGSSASPGQEKVGQVAFNYLNVSSDDPPAVSQGNLSDVRASKELPPGDRKILASSGEHTLKLKIEAQKASGSHATGKPKEQIMAAKLEKEMADKLEKKFPILGMPGAKYSSEVIDGMIADNIGPRYTTFEPKGGGGEGNSLKREVYYRFCQYLSNIVMKNPMNSIEINKTLTPEIVSKTIERCFDNKECGVSMEPKEQYKDVADKKVDYSRMLAKMLLENGWSGSKATQFAEEARGFF